MKKITFLSLIISLLLLPFCRSAQKSEPISHSDTTTVQGVIDSFDKQLEEEHLGDTVGSLSAIVFIGNKIAWSRAFGKADNEKGIDATVSTVYRIGSISKTFTAYLMMLLVQDGTIGLDEPVAKYLPEIKQLKWKKGIDTNEITFRELASHTGGLAMEPGLWNAAAGPIGEWENKILSSIPTTDVTFSPGTKFSYSNIGYGILGLALSRAAHKPFMQMVENRIFKPLHMTSSFYIIPTGFEDSVAVGYHRNSFGAKPDGKVAKTEYAGRGYKVPNGGIYTTTGDLARFIMAQCSDSDQLAKKYREMMQTIHTPGDGKHGYGFGLFVVNADDGSNFAGHDGSVAGYTAFMLFNPRSKVGAIVMRNCDYGVQQIEGEVAKVVKGLAKIVGK
ncbi:serine hydrolase domain-containing protein [Flavitalea sp. BT771]|uniref:serine hydrolase domain-containing protein n=1 Tax=Flavitalea sp. BT771 TaxID=3063329 RepID=UPI0026E165F8|nr:serine hydrolase domain-containing protein [Flavitalea sp. BT771]MDO6435454.1 serine hydrolase domain-containing protein [Flavitalea sp. BT771]MDV6224186.1 serine hydrolase domain-containing protein [Flavitalea sp. BT771]